MVTKKEFDPVAEAAGFIKELSEYERPEWKLNVKKAALLIIDMQNAFVHERGSIYLPAARKIIPVINAVATAFRQAGRAVIFTRHAEDPAGANAGLMREWWGPTSPQEGTWDAELFAGLTRAPGDQVVSKIRYNAFLATDLEQRLRQAGVADVVIAGVMTNLCCETTAREAFMRDYRVFFLADATAAPTREMHRASLLNLAYGFAVVTTSEIIVKALGSG